MTFQEGIALKTAPYLSVEVLEPSNFDKMKVGPALNVFSKATSAGVCQRQGLQTTALKIHSAVRGLKLLSQHKLNSIIIFVGQFHTMHY